MAVGDLGLEAERLGAARRAAALGLGVSLSATCLPGEGATIELSSRDGDWRGRFDTTLTVGAAVRVEDRDPALIGRANGGRANSVNVDDGNLNFDRGDFTSLGGRVVHELDLGWREFGFFGRVYYFYDAAIMDIEPERTAFTDAAKDHAGRDIELLDAYVTADLEAGEVPLTMRAGNMVLSWGESTFIPNGVNVINPVDVTQLRTAGAEIREALTPVPIVDVDLGLTDALSLEAFYQIAWDHTELDPAGTYFSTADFLGPGGDRLFLGFGGIADTPPFPPGSFVPRGPDNDADNDGQFGLALRYFADALSDTEFGLYYVRHHSRLPLVSARTGTLAGVLAGDYPASARYFVEYPDNIDLFGASFNTALGALGGRAAGRGLVPQGPAAAGRRRGAAVRRPLAARSLPADAGLRREPARQLWLRPGDPRLPARGRAAGAADREQAARPHAPRRPDRADRGGRRHLRAGAPGPGRAALQWPRDLHQRQPRLHGGGHPAGDHHRWLRRRLLVGLPVARPDGFPGRHRPDQPLPPVAFAHDVDGTTPEPLGNFVEGRKALTLTLAGTYLNAVRGELSFTSFFGGGDFNLLKDRDFVSLAFSYSF